MSNEFPCNFKNLANVGDVIRAEILRPARDRLALSFVVGTVIEKTEGGYRIQVEQASFHGRPDGEMINSAALIPYGTLEDWADRVTIVRAGSNRAIENLSKALDGAKSMIDGMLQRDEIQQEEIARFKGAYERCIGTVETRDDQIKQLREEIAKLLKSDSDKQERLDAQGYDLISVRRTLSTVCEHRDLLERKALTVDLLAKQRDEALLEAQRQNAARKEAVEQLAQMAGTLGRYVGQVLKLRADLNHADGQLEKAQADYRDLQSRVLKDPKEEAYLLNLS